jgi:ankyrin repeat protein
VNKTDLDSELIEAAKSMDMNQTELDQDIRNAALEGNIDRCESLLNAGASPTAANPITKRALLYYASINGHIDVCRLLLERGADVNALDDEGKSALFAAADSGHAGVCRLLIDRGADVAMASKTGRLPLHAAAIRGYEDVCRVLIEHGADVTAVAHEVDHWTPLHFAVSRDHLGTCRILVKLGADSKAKTSSDATPFQIAVRKGNVSLAQYFLQECGEDVYQLTGEGVPLDQTVRSNVVNMVRFLSAYRRSLKTEHIIAEALEAIEAIEAPSSPSRSFGPSPL